MKIRSVLKHALFMPKLDWHLLNHAKGCVEFPKKPAKENHLRMPCRSFTDLQSERLHAPRATSTDKNCELPCRDGRGQCALCKVMKVFGQVSSKAGFSLSDKADISDFFRDFIESGIARKKSALPTKGDTSQDMRMSRQTVTNTYIKQVGVRLSAGLNLAKC